MPTLKEISEKTGLKYSNARLYVKALEKRNLISPKRSGKSFEFPEETINLINSLKTIVREQKLDLNEAIDILVSGEMNDPISRLSK